jgi:predicted PurR-regulated permease PerM
MGNSAWERLEGEAVGPISARLKVCFFRGVPRMDGVALVCMTNLPTIFQKKALWTAVTAVSLTVTAGIAIGLVYGTTQVLAFLQPILVPFALAGVLAYLLEPAVVWLEGRKLSRQRAVLLVFALFVFAIGGLSWYLFSKVSRQMRNMDGKVAVYAEKVRASVVGFSSEFEAKYGLQLLPDLAAFGGEVGSGSEAKTALVEGGAEVTKGAIEEGEVAEEGADAEAQVNGGSGDFSLRQFLSGEWVKKSLPGAVAQVWRTVKSSVGGFLGAFGFILSMIIVPLYLYYFLIESAHIKETWSNYLPLRASAFKDELVDCLTEINGYLIAFFRGQLLVSAINGVATGLGLMIIGLDFGLIIGLMLCVLGIIPYLGIAVCWIPAVAIAAVQGGSALVPGDPWWMLPLVVTIIFAVVQQIDGFVISPKIVGESVGLHPMTVIVSVFVWSLLLGGLLGAILAVPLTASVKVLFQRYVWLARLAPQTVGGSGRGGSPTGSE